MKSYITGNFNLMPLAKYLGGSEAVSVGDFNDYRRVLGGTKGAVLNECDFVICLIDGVELAAEALFDANALWPIVDDYLNLCDSFAQANPGKFLIASTIRLPAFGPYSFHDAISGVGSPALERHLFDGLTALAQKHANFIIFDLSRLIGYFGERVVYNNAMRYFGRFGYSGPFCEEIARSVRRLAQTSLQASKKVLAIDFDNTLWGGVLGEMGANGVTLSQDGVGRAYRQFQALLKQLVGRGILLVGLTKNDEAEIDEIFATNSMMVLSREDFVQICANWRPKPDNLVEVAQHLNLGLDSFVFIDDNPFERSAIRELLPLVTVPDFPSSPEYVPHWFVEDVVPEYFSAYRVTREDQLKTKQYQGNLLRSQLMTASSYDEFLSNLNISLDFYINEERHAGRISQMTQKTNQFNLTTRRYSVAEIQEIIRHKSHDVVAMSYQDRFGNEGIVGLAILSAAGFLDTFLLSCRVIGRGVEDQLLAQIEHLAQKRRLSELLAEFRSTGKNDVARDFLPSRGFTRLDDGPDSHGAKYRKVIHELPEIPTSSEYHSERSSSADRADNRRDQQRIIG
jgi:FkbH-like protein